MYTNAMKFVDTHEWVKLDDNAELAQLGITHHAQELLGDLVYIELPEVGQVISLGQTIGVVESVKAASDLYAPVSGEVVAVNHAVVSDPTLANHEPHTNGWLLQLKLTNPSELDNLLTAEAYQALIG
ncbi:MAG: glycine cleavage system protein [Pseudomonadota bacterium]|jgi:glycine cleavage system H protein